ncbi:MAG TPA: hypothetical protein VHA09_01440 [Nitrososphaera sp.]|nr:hypothetical protein [Nitrososphaera sp.]
MLIPRKNSREILVIPLAFVMVITIGTIATTTEAKYAWAVMEDNADKSKGTISGGVEGGSSHEDVERPKEPLPLSAVEYMVTFARGAADKTAVHPVVPDPITVKNSGANVTFVNDDNVAHTAVQGVPGQGQSGFDSGVIGAGKNATVTVRGQPNESIPYFCRIHPWLTGTIQIASENSSTNAATATGNQTGQQQAQQQQPSQALGTAGSANGNSSHIRTFTVGGTIASWAAGSNNTGNVISPEVLSGRWSLQVVNGIARSFDANITMVNSNGSGYHTHRLSNFRVTDESLSTTLIHNQTGSQVAAPLEIASSSSSLSIPGTIDISANGTKTWADTNVNVMINQWHSLYIATDEAKTGNHFTEGHFAPGIYGVVDSIKDKNGNELFQNGKVNLQGG